MLTRRFMSGVSALALSTALAAVAGRGAAQTTINATAPGDVVTAINDANAG